MTLTEQWKKGELEQGWYYIECIDLPERWIDIDYYRNDCYEDKGFCKGFFDHNDWRGIDKVLAPVPSYEEWQQLRKFLEEFNALDVAKENEALKTKLSIQCDANEELRRACKMRDKIIKKYEDIDDWWKAENQQLKELLKECKDVLLSYSNISGDYELYDKITNAIGEKK